MSVLNLNQQVLVLNRLWQAVNICTVRRALTLLFEDRAQAVTGFEDGSFQTFDFLQWKDFSEDSASQENIRTISFNLRIPKVILLRVYDRLFERDKNTCQYCALRLDRIDLNLDHVIPRDQGGPTSWENIVTSCIPCNTRKSNKSPSEAGLKLIRKPKKPKWRPFLQVSVGLKPHDSWKHFLDVAYWNVELGDG